VAGARDPYNLVRFVRAQEGCYDRALAEIRDGHKVTHWMWYVFPQFEGLGSSKDSENYSIKSFAEATAYLRHPVLGPRLRECAEAALSVKNRSAERIFGRADSKKLRSCATLFALVLPAQSVFERLLDMYT
jgi:uncharacterized protein (DUF1810 family)